MQPNNQPRIGLLAIRVSSDKQGLDGDSPEAQREQGEAYAKAHNIIITKTLMFIAEKLNKDFKMLLILGRLCFKIALTELKRGIVWTE